MKQAKIIGTGSYLPKKVLTNADLEKMVDTSDEWIVTRTGMKERRIASDEEASSDLGVQAALRAIAKAQIDPQSIDLILVTTLTPDYLFPSTACIIQSKLKLERIPAMDLQAACSGYIYAMHMAQAFIISGQYRTILMIAPDKLSSIVDYEDRSTCVLFGDGAAACVISDQGRGLTIREVVLGCDGGHTEIVYMPAGGSRLPTSKDTVEKKLHYIKMEGKEVFKHAVRRMQASCKECIDKANLKEDQISWLIPHQANSRIIDAVAKRFGVANERIFITMEKYGNTSSSSIGIALDEFLDQETLSAGDNLLLTAFGAGLTWGSAVLSKEDT